MSHSYPNAAAFRQALETRIRTAAAERCVQIQGLRLKIAIERLLARLFHDAHPPCLLKGSYATELCFRLKARTTRDVDLTIDEVVDFSELPKRLVEVREMLDIARKLDLANFFEFIIPPARGEIQAAPGGGGVFSVLAKIAARVCPLPQRPWIRRWCSWRDRGSHRRRSLSTPRADGNLPPARAAQGSRSPSHAARSMARRVSCDGRRGRHFDSGSRLRVYSDRGVLGRPQRARLPRSNIRVQACKKKHGRPAIGTPSEGGGEFLARTRVAITPQREFVSS